MCSSNPPAAYPRVHPVSRPYDERRKNDPVLKARRREQNYRRRLQKQFGLDPHEYHAILASQKGVCAICLKEPKETFNVDHCHRLGKVRGLLCRKCNLALGHFEDDLASVFRAAAYLMQATNPVDA